LAAIIRQLAGWKKGRNPVTAEKNHAVHAALTALFLIVFIFCLITTMAMPFATGIFPILVCVPAILIGITLLARSVLSMREEERFRFAWSSVSAEARLVIAAGVMGLLILAFGHLAAPPAFIVIAALYFRRFKLFTVGAYAAATFIASYLIFDMFSNQSWPTPWIFNL
jgi:hypothetical protein